MIGDLANGIRATLRAELGNTFFRKTVLNAVTGFRVGLDADFNVLRQGIRKIDETADKALQHVAMEAGKRIVFRNPILTGRSRAHWIASVNSPNFGFNTRTPYPRATASKRAPASYGSTVVRRNNRLIRTAKNGDTIYLSNNQYYVRLLEYGRSPQASFGFIRLTMLEMAYTYPRVFKSLYLETQGSIVPIPSP